MDSDTSTSAKKIIFFLMDMILIMGAIVGILTIDGGKWLINNPAFYQAPEGEMQENAAMPVALPAALPLAVPAGVQAGSPLLIPVTGADGGRETSEAKAPRTEGGCSIGAHAAGPEY